MVLKKTRVSYKSISQLLINVQEGNLTTTTLALISLNEVLTPDVKCIQALIDKRAVKLFLNILDAKFLCVRRSQFAALRCLTKICDSKVLQKEVLSLNGVQLLFQSLSTSDFELMFAAIHLISNISSDPASWEPANECGGIHQLVSLLDTSKKKLTFTTQMSKSDVVQLKLSVAEYAAKSLSLLCEHEANRKVACSSNIISICYYWIKSKHQKVIIPILILLQKLCTQVNFRKQVNESHVIVDVFNHLQSANMELKQVAADLILICADDQETFRYFHKQEFVQEIFQMVSNKSFYENEALMTSITGILWKCSKTETCIKQLEKLTVVPVFTQLLESPSLQKANLNVENSLDGIECIIDILKSKNKTLLTPACTLIHNLAKDKNAVSVLVEFNVANHLVKLMKTKDKKLLQQLCLAVASCCSSKLSCEKFRSCGVTKPLIKTLRAENRALKVTAAAALSRIAALSNWCPEEYQDKIFPVLTDLLTDLRNKEGNESSAVILRHILCIYNKETVPFENG